MLSPWVVDEKTRFNYGIVYNCLISVLFVVNVLLVIRVVYRDGAIKLKKAYLIYKRQ